MYVKWASGSVQSLSELTFIIRGRYASCEEQNKEEETQHLCKVNINIYSPLLLLLLLDDTILFDR